ncbi:MAG: arsenate reductase ArsC [Elusimicrobiota bacterium]|jgi:arsenate reductase
MTSSNQPLKLLFLCTGNSARSQMAEGWAKELKRGPIEAYSAGTNPKPVHPLAVKVMAESGVDISGQRSKHVDTLKEYHYDFVITVCDHARETCPLFPAGPKLIHRGFEDPAAAKGSEDKVLAMFRRVRDQVRDFVEGMPENLKGAKTP